MAGLEANTDSYNQPLSVGALEQAQKIGALKQQSQQIESGGLTIDKQKLDNANQGLTYLTRAMTSLGPDATKEQYKAVGENAVRMGLVPAQQLQVWNERVDAAPNSKTFYNEVITAAASHQEAINYHLGQGVNVSNGQTVTPAVTSVKPGFGVRPITAPIQQQIPPTAEVATPAGNQALGPQNARTPEGTLPIQGGLPGQYTPSSVPRASRLPIADRNAADAGANPTAFENKNGYKPTGPMTSQAPMFEEGKKQLAEDQELATQKLTSIKPALQALPLMKDLRTGPGTAAWTTAVAALKANNIISTDANDPTAIRQEVNKKLADYLRSSPVGQRSDAAQALSQSASPDPNGQINQALVKLTKDAIALDRVQAARAAAFENNDYSKYGNYRANFPAQIDERAFGIDLMEPKERQALIKDMREKAAKGTAEGLRFKKSLEIAYKQGLVNTP